MLELMLMHVVEWAPSMLNLDQTEEQDAARPKVRDTRPSPEALVLTRVARAKLWRQVMGAVESYIDQVPPECLGPQLDPAAARALLRSLSQTAVLPEDEAAGLAIERLALEVMFRASLRKTRTPRSGAPGWVLQAKALIERQYAHPITLPWISQAVGVHPSHLAKTFRKHFSCSVGEYVRRLRIDSARDALVHSDATIAQVAARAGFYDQSHFTNSFRRHTGLTPQAYRSAFSRLASRGSESRAS